MSNCVNKSSKEFKDCCKRLNVSVTTLEPIIHEFINIEGNENSFPSDVYIEERIHGKSMEVLEDVQVQLWEKEYSQPKVFETSKDAVNYYNECNKYFPKESIGLKETSDGKYEVRVAEVVNTNELEEIKQKAIADGTFMKAPNGKPTNLTERQWLSVRTKSFKKWFGDWENNPENASKVVDENGEPLVVYHHTDNPNLTKFSIDFDNYFSKDGGTKLAIFFDEEKTGTLNRKYAIPVFLNIRNLNEYNETKAQLHERGTTYREVVNQSAKTNSVDGGVHMKDFDDNMKEHQSIWIVHNPNQIKSAKFNIGYSEKDDNIYHENEWGVDSSAKRDNRLEELRKQDSVSVVDLLNLIDSNSEYSSIIELLKTKKQKGTPALLTGIKVKVVSSISTPYSSDVQKLQISRGVYRRAYYDAATKELIINSDGRYNGGRADSVILHEIIHHITVNRIKSNTKFREEFDAIIDKYVEAFPYSSSKYKKDRNKHYIEEFIADIWSDKHTIEQLKSIKSDKKLTLWDRIKNFFVKIFSGSEGTLMADASDALYRLLDELETGISNDTFYEGENRAQINPNETQFITESFVPSDYAKSYGLTESKLTAALNELKEIEDSYASLQSPITMSYKQYKDAVGEENTNLTNAYIELDKKAPDYNKTTKQITLPSEFYFKIAEHINKHKEFWSFVNDANDEGIDNLELDYNGSHDYYELGSLDSLLDAFEKSGHISYRYSDSRQRTIEQELEDLTQEEIDKLNTQKKEVLSAIQKENLKLNQQIKNLQDSKATTTSEFNKLATDLAYDISDHLTEWQENPKEFYKAFPEKAEDDKDIRSMSRAELVEYVGINNLLNYIKEKRFGSTNDDIDIEKALLYYENFEALIRFGANTFNTMEDFNINYSEIGYKVEMNKEDDTTDALSNEEQSITEECGDKQEHWQIDSRTIDNFLSMSQTVKRELARCYELDEVGNIIQNEFGINERVNPKDATSCILRWTQGALSLKDMIAKLEEKSKNNPWVKTIISKLKDTSGKYSDFQSQFYGVFCKHFQNYYIVKEFKDDDGTKSLRIMPVNLNPALKEVLTSIEVMFKLQQHPLFSSKGINKEHFENLKKRAELLKEITKDSFDKLDLDRIATGIQQISSLLGYDTSHTVIKEALTEKTLKTLVDKANSIVYELSKNLDNPTYNPFTFNKKAGIRGYLGDFLTPLTDKLEDVALSAFYDNGKMYQSYIIPSFLTKLVKKFHNSDEKAFKEFMEKEYGQYDWFRDTSMELDTKSSWKSEWLKRLYYMSAEERAKLFDHKVQLSFNGHNYMRDMTGPEYVLSVITEYFSGTGDSKESMTTAWYKVPMMSNKPSLEFIKFIRYTGIGFETSLLKGYLNIFNQELQRISLVNKRGYTEGDDEFISGFDSNGKKFCFLDFLNEFVGNNSTRLGELLTRKIKEDNLNNSEEKELQNEVKKQIETELNTRATKIIQQYKNSGLFDVIKTIDGAGTTDVEVEANLREFVWNDTFAAMQILQMTITDIAYYKNAEDLQKRLAQIHAPGIRGNVNALDYTGKPVCDGKLRGVFLADYEGEAVKQNIIENLIIVFDRKVAESKGEEAKYWRELGDAIIKQFKKDVNVADAQAYNCPTSYRKKAIMFGKWSKEAEALYQKIKQGRTVNLSDIQTTFQVIKPFVYTHVEKDSGVGPKLKVGMQFKNSEYLLIMADAILRNEDTGKPNLLRAIFNAMEKSAEIDNTKGIDTFMFASAVKAGLHGTIDIAEMTEEEAYNEIITKIGDFSKGYNQTYVHEYPAEDYTIQQEVPKHFMEHKQAHGSQERYIIPSDLALVDSNEKEVTYDYIDNNKLEKKNAKEFREEYENTIANSIEESIDLLYEELGLNLDPETKNIALSQVLQSEILSNSRYGMDLYFACSLNDKGEFNIPLGDPIQAKRIEQLINSIVKNRINKQKIAGGPVVQVSNFGMSKRLNIKFKDKTGGLLLTYKEWSKKNPGKSYAEYKDYITKNQGGVAHYECYAPAYMKEMLEDFLDENGDVDIEAIQEIAPEMLDMVGYRIPSEDAYSIAPLKIVGFLPKEAGEGIVMPYEITLITGSDRIVVSTSII